MARETPHAIYTKASKDTAAQSFRPYEALLAPASRAGSQCMLAGRSDWPDQPEASLCSADHRLAFCHP